MRCDCGGEKHGWPHSDWCTVYSSEPQVCFGVTGPCGKTGSDVHERSSMTMYIWDGKSKDPNATGPLCADCHKEYVDIWQERWDEYYAGCL